MPCWRRFWHCWTRLGAIEHQHQLVYDTVDGRNPAPVGRWFIPYCLVVWLPFFIFPYIGNVIIPIDFHIFQRVAQPPTSIWLSNLQCFIVPNSSQRVISSIHGPPDGGFPRVSWVILGSPSHHSFRTMDFPWNFYQPAIKGYLHDCGNHHDWMMDGWWMDDWWWLMGVKQCHKAAMTGNGHQTTYKTGDDWGMVYGSVLLIFIIYGGHVP